MTTILERLGLAEDASAYSIAMAITTENSLSCPACADFSSCDTPLDHRACKAQSRIGGYISELIARTRREERCQALTEAAEVARQDGGPVIGGALAQRFMELIGEGERTISKMETTAEGASR